MSFWQSKAAITPADRDFSLIVRELHGWRCERCGKLCRVGGTWYAKLDCSHYIGRAKRSTRYDTENARSLCNSCHQRMGGYKREENGEYDLWMKELLGEKGYRNLVLRANLPYHGDKALEVIYVRQLRKQLTLEGTLT